MHFWQVGNDHYVDHLMDFQNGTVVVSVSIWQSYFLRLYLDIYTMSGCTSERCAQMNLRVYKICAKNINRSVNFWKCDLFLIWDEVINSFRAFYFPSFFDLFHIIDAEKKISYVNSLYLPLRSLCPQILILNGVFPEGVLYQKGLLWRMKSLQKICSWRNSCEHKNLVPI